MVIFVDIDKTIFRFKTKQAEIDCDYTQVEPIVENIAKINKLYRSHTIVYWTSRGMKSNLNWYHVTVLQLQEHGCKYSELRMGKPFYDLFIDDKACRMEDLECYLS